MADVVDKSPGRVQRMFSAIAPRYDLLNHLLSLEVDRYWRWRTARLARGLAGRVLDVCTGTGDLALALACQAQHAEVWGIDFCRPMLEIARRKILQRRLSHRVRLIEADALELPFQDDAFMMVTIAFGLRNLCDMDRGLRQMQRVCAPGGRLAILEFSQPTWKPWAALYGWYFRHVVPCVGQWLARNKEAAYQYLPESVGQFPCGSALAERIRQAGFRHVTFRHLTGGVAMLYVATK